jgi:glycosyltransferase involved in cell wall biosynthesis
MRLWIFNHHATAPDQGSGTRHYDLASQLAQSGHDVTIFAAGFNHFTGREERLAGWQLFRSESWNGVRFVWLRTVPYRHNDLRRLFSMVSYLLVAVVVQSRFGRPTHVIGSTVHPLAALGGYLVARAHGARFDFEIRDLWPQSLIDLGALREGSAPARVLRWLERILAERGSGVIAVLPGVGGYLAEHDIQPSAFLYLPNGVALARESGGALAGPTRRLIERMGQWRSEGRFVLLYAGSHGIHNRLAVVLDAARRLPEPDRRIMFVLVGDGTEKPALAANLDAEPTENIFLHPPIPKSDVPTLLAAADACLLHMTRTPVYRYGISFNKLFDYMASGRPVLFACEASNDPVAEADSGLSVPPDDPDAMAAAAARLSHLPSSELARLGANGRRYVEEHHDVRELARQLAGFLAERP